MLDKYCFLSKHHIRHKTTFDGVFNSRKRLNSPYGVLRFAPNHLDYARLGIIASKRNVPLAVTRNRIRRILKERFRLHPIKDDGYDVVFVVYKQAAAAPSKELNQCIEHLFNMLVKRSQGS